MLHVSLQLRRMRIGIALERERRLLPASLFGVSCTIVVKDDGPSPVRFRYLARDVLSDFHYQPHSEHHGASHDITVSAKYFRDANGRRHCSYFCRELRPSPRARFHARFAARCRAPHNRRSREEVDIVVVVVSPDGHSRADARFFASCWRGAMPKM